MTDPLPPESEWTDDMMYEYQKWVRRWRREHDKVVRLTAALREVEQRLLTMKVEAEAVTVDAPVSVLPNLVADHAAGMRVCIRAALVGETTDGS